MVGKRDTEWQAYRLKKLKMIAACDKIKADFWSDNCHQYRSIERLDEALEDVERNGTDPLQAYLKAK
jgi:hypothetical protein